MLRRPADGSGVPTLRPHEYGAERRRLVAGDGRAWLHGSGLDRSFPTTSQVENAFHTDDRPGWDRALVAAGLDVRKRDGGSAAGVPVAQAVEMFLGDVGCLPWTETALLQYGTLKGISLPRATDSFRDHFAQVREDRASRGLWTPSRPPGRGARPPIEVASMTDPPVVRRERKKWEDLDTLIEGVMAAYDIATARGERTLTRRLHVQLAKEHRGVIPAPSVVDRRAVLHGRTAEWVRAEAKRRRRAVRAGASRGLSTAI